MLYKHILFATDLSDETGTVIPTVEMMTKHSNADLSIVHVLEYTPVVFGSGEFSIPLDMNLEEYLTQNARKVLTVIAHQLDIESDSQYISHGSIKREIINLAERLNVDLIILGTHGRSGIKMLLGSTANAVLHAAKCDVLVVRV
jgi:universal stress protein A